MRSSDDELDEGPLESDKDSTDEPGVIDCPYCGASISELGDLCPKCDRYVSQEDGPPPPKPRMFVLTVVALIVMLMLGYVCMK